MNPASEYTMFADKLHDEATDLFIQANREYSNDETWTSNFDTVAHFVRMRHPDFKPRDAAFTYLMKSVFSIARNHTERQSMRSRYLDAINYLTFMAWMDAHDHDVEMTTSQRQNDLIDETAPRETERVPEVPAEWPVYGNVAPPPMPVDAIAAELEISEMQQNLHKKSVDERMKEWQAIKDRMYDKADNNEEIVTKMSAEHLDKSVGI